MGLYFGSILSLSSPAIWIIEMKNLPIACVTSLPTAPLLRLAKTILLLLMQSGILIVLLPVVSAENVGFF